MIRWVLILLMLPSVVFARGGRSNGYYLETVTTNGTLSGTGQSSSPLGVVAGSVLPAAHDHSTATQGGVDLRPTTLDITTSIRLPSTAPSAARQIAVTSGGDFQWHDGTAPRGAARKDRTINLVDANSGSTLTFSGSGSTLGDNVTITLTGVFGTAANNLAMGSKTLTLVDANSGASFAFGNNGQPIGANISTTITPTFGTSGGNFVQGNQTATITAGNGLTGGISGDALGDGFAASLAVGAGTGITVNADDIAVNYGTTSTTAARGDKTLTLANGAGSFTFGSNGGAIGNDRTIDITATFDNPTARVGAAAVNGTATTFMRSDAAPAIDQAGAYNFTALVGATTQDITVTNLTATRVPYVGVSGKLVDSSNLTFNGTTLSLGGRLDSTVSTGEVFRAISGTTGSMAHRIKNTGNDLYIGIEGNTAAGFFNGSTAYSAVIYSSTPIQQIVGGVSEITASGGIEVGAATGGRKGVGTINCAGDIYKNNSAYTNPDYVFEQAFTGEIVKYANRPGAASYKPRSIEEMETYVRRYHRFPGIQDRATGVFERSDFVLERLEEQFLYVATLNRECKELKRRLAALEVR